MGADRGGQRGDEKFAAAQRVGACAQRIDRKEVRTAGCLAVVGGPAGLPQQGGAARTKPRSCMSFDHRASELGRTRGREDSDGESKLRQIPYKHP